MIAFLILLSIINGYISLGSPPAGIFFILVSNRLAEIPFTKNSIRVPNAHSLHHDGCFFIAG